MYICIYVVYVYVYVYWDALFICNISVLFEVSISLGRFAGQRGCFVTDSLRDCSKRLRRSEREFVGDHAHLHQHQHWYKDSGIPAEGVLRGNGTREP